MKALILGAGGAASIGVARCLEDEHLIGADCDPHALQRAPVTERHLLPRAGEEGYWAALSLLVEQTGPDYIHAQADPEVLVLAENQDELAEMGVATFLPPWEHVALCQDKWTSYKVWEDAGVPAPETILATSPTALKNFFNKPIGEAWIRKRKGAGGLRSCRTSSISRALRHVREETGWMDHNYTVAKAMSDDTVTVQQLWAYGELVFSQQRQRLGWANNRGLATPVSGATGVGRISADTVATILARQASQAISDHCKSSAHGLYGVDMVYDSEGVPLVTEINCGRFFTTAPDFFRRMGWNMMEVLFDAMELDIYEPQIDPMEEGWLWIRGMDVEPVLIHESEVPAVGLALSS